MATTSFKKREEAAPQAAPATVDNGEQVIPASKAVVVREDRAPAPAFASVGGFTGSWDLEDVRLPRINLIHKTSDNQLIKQFGIGGFAFNKEVKLSDGEAPGITVVAVRALKDYVQKLPYGSPEMPAVFSSPEEVEANGGSLNYKDADSGNFFGPRAHIQLLIAAPEGASEADMALFPYTFDGKAYAMGILTVASSAYTSVGKELATLCNNNKVMRKGMHYGALALTSEVRKNAKNSWHIPVIKFTGENSPELIQFIESL
jgi:hypothetical protein